MRVLLVEDEDPSVTNALAMLDRAAPGSLVHIARSRDSAIKALEAECFDVVLCDIRIPPSDGSLGVAEDHGLAVHAFARTQHPGTPLIFLTAFATSKSTRASLSAGPAVEMFGKYEFPLVQLAEKGDPRESEELVREIAEGLAGLDELCSVSFPPGEEPDEMLLRATRMYAQRLDAVSARLEFLRGLSGASVARVWYEERAGGRPAVLAKVLDRVNALEELERYNRFVPNRLAPGMFAPSIPPILFGLRDRAALFFTLADPASRSLFQVLADDPGSSGAVVGSLRAGLRPWEPGAEGERWSLEALRAERITEERLSDSRLDACRRDIEALLSSESVSVKMPSAVVHGDLHCENVLVDSSGRPVLIDFGDVGRGPAALDPITLELSVVFHTLSPVPATDWLDPDLARAWGDLDRYAGASPFPVFIRACREWAMEAAGLDGVHAVAYAHAMRQLKYKDVPPELAVGIAAGAQARLTGA